MTGGPDTLVFDTGPLRHFTPAGWLGVLRFVADGRAVIVPESVELELLERRHTHPSLAQIFDADWISIDRSEDILFLSAFAGYEKRLVANRRNRGECGVLALGKTRGHQLVLDD